MRSNLGFPWAFHIPALRVCYRFGQTQRPRSSSLWVQDLGRCQLCQVTTNSTTIATTTRYSLPPSTASPLSSQASSYFPCSATWLTFRALPSIKLALKVSYHKLIRLAIHGVLLQISAYFDAHQEMFSTYSGIVKSLLTSYLYVYVQMYNSQQAFKWAKFSLQSTRVHTIVCIYLQFLNTVSIRGEWGALSAVHIQ